MAIRNCMADETAKQATLGPQLLTVTVLAESEPTSQNPDQDPRL